MPETNRVSLLSRVARLGNSEVGPSVSVLCLAGATYGSNPDAEATVPTGFDPMAVALFEAIVEGAYLVATADGVFDDAERRTFEDVVIGACGGTVPPAKLRALISDLADQLAEDGMAVRMTHIARIATRKEHAEEVLRIGALLAMASEGVSATERRVLAELARVMNLAETDVEDALAAVARELSRDTTP